MPSASNKLEKQTSLSSVSVSVNEIGIHTLSEQKTMGTENINASAAFISASVPNTSEGSGSNVKSGVSLDASNPMKQSLVTIEHKIRNLEKRKTKLESYRAIQATGKELSADQKAAVAKYDAVVATLDFARDLYKQMMQFAKDAEKEQKKQARKEAIARAHVETAKVREVLIIQNILSCFSDEAVRTDFLNGNNGAVKMMAGDIEALEKFCIDIHTRRPESVDDAAFVNTTQRAAELFSMTIDGRPKQYNETTFENMRKIFNQIQDCGYLDKLFLPTVDIATEVNRDVDCPPEGDEEVVTSEKFDMENEVTNMKIVDGDPGIDEQAELNLLIEKQPPLLVQQPVRMQSQFKDQIEIQSINTSMQTSHSLNATGSTLSCFTPPVGHSDTATPVHVNIYPTQQLQQPSSQLQQVQPPGGIVNASPSTQQLGSQKQQQPSQQRQMMTSPNAASQLTQGAPITIQPSHFPPTTVRAVEQSFFKQHQHQQYLQQMRPLAEVIGAGSFYFLQESELDSPEIGGVTAGNTVSPQVTNTGVFEQQPNMMGHAEMTNMTDIHKSQPQPTQQEQPISSQTFTNQSFPPITQSQPTNTNTTVNNGKNPSNNGNPSPMFPQNTQQIFPLVGGLQQQQQQEITSVNSNNSQQAQIILKEQPPQMLMMARLNTVTPQTRLSSPQQHLPTASLGLQSSDVGSANVSFPFENAVVNVLSYEQQMQQQLANASSIQTSMADEKKMSEDSHKYVAEPSVTEWDASISGTSHSVDSNSTVVPTSLTSSLKPSVIENNKWSSSPIPSNTQNRKNEWTSSSGGGVGGSSVSGYDDTSTQSAASAHEANHWNSNQQQDGTGHFSNNGRFHRRRGRSNNYGSTSAPSQQQNSNGARGNNSGIYFRNNESTSSGSSYYQNGNSNIYSGVKDSGGRYESGGGSNYRGPRSGGSGGNTRGNVPQRAVGRGGGNSSVNSSVYIGTRQSNRMSMGLENKN